MRNAFKIVPIIGLCLLSLGMARHGQYDEEQRQIDKMDKEMKDSGYSATQPVKDVASGVKQATYDSTKELVNSTAEGTTDNPPVVGTVKGVYDGTGKVLENTSKGVAKVVTLGHADSNSFRVEEPEHRNEDDTTKVKFNF
jgi:hypothetical protein